MAFSFENSEQSVYEFEKLLSKHRIKIKSGSELEKVSLKIMEANEKFKGRIKHDNKVDFRKDMSEVASLIDLLYHILRLKDHPDFTQLIPHFNLLNESKSIAFTTKSLISDSGNNKLFELYIALLCMDIGTNIRLDHPDNSKGDNPDILLEYAGSKWGIACKAMHTENIKTLFERIEDGTRQINNSEAEKGIVIVNMKNVFHTN
jgi:hypothetical protein